MARTNGTITSYDIQSGEVVIQSDRKGEVHQTSLEKTHDFFEPSKTNLRMEMGRPKIGERVAFILDPITQNEIAWWGYPDSTIGG